MILLYEKGEKPNKMVSEVEVSYYNIVDKILYVLDKFGEVHIVLGPPA